MQNREETKLIWHLKGNYICMVIHCCSVRWCQHTVFSGILAEVMDVSVHHFAPWGSFTKHLTLSESAQRPYNIFLLCCLRYSYDSCPSSVSIFYHPNICDDELWIVKNCLPSLVWIGTMVWYIIRLKKRGASSKLDHSEQSWKMLYSSVQFQYIEASAATAVALYNEWS